MKKLYIYFLLFILTHGITGFAQTANWSAISPSVFPTNASGQIHGISRVSQLKFHPTNSNKMYAVSARGGLFISQDGGSNWAVTPGTDNLPYSAFASVCIDHTNDQIIYLGAGDHDYYYDWGGASGVWKSTNGGLTFTQTTLSSGLIIDMVMDPADHNVVVAVTNNGVYKTVNGGTSWTLKSSSRAFDDLKQKTPTSRVLYAATRDSAFFRSTDFGETWTQITTGIVLPPGVTNGNGCRVAVTPADTNVVYLGMVANSGLIYKSTNGGTSFSAVKTTVPPYLTYYDNLSSSSGQGDYNFGIGVDRINANIIYLVSHNVWKSTDGGVNWTQLTNWWAKVHTDMHQVMTNPYNNNQVWDMNDGGVWLSTDGGNNWTPKSDGICGYEIYHGSCSPTRRDMISIGTQDNGELYATSPGGWFTNRGGDWQSHCVFDYRANSSMAYYFLPDWGGVPVPSRRLVNGSDATYGLPSYVTDFTDIAFNRSNTNLAFVADSVILRTTNLTVTTPSWTQIASLGKKIMTLHSSFADANRLYAITSDGFIYVSTNALSGSPTFTSYALPNSSNNVATITTIKSSPNTVYITCNTKVYRSTDNGVNWTNITYNLPSVNHTRILADEYFSTSELVFVASNGVVYYKTVNATTWSAYNTNLPSRTSIVDMSIYNDSTANTLLRVATYGRGMWETPITNLRALNANLMADNTNPCPGTSVQFSDLSTGNVVTRSWSFPGGTPSSSAAQNPVVIYNSSGSYSVSLTVSNGTSNNSITKTNYIITNGSSLPLSEGFEGTTDPPDGWKNIDNGTTGFAWAKTSAASGFGTSANSMTFNNYAWNVPGEKDELQVKRLDFSGYNSVTLTFDVAYQVYTGYVDSLIVLVSTDCGNNFTRVYAKGGSTLSTAGSATSAFVPTAAQWRTESVNLNSFAGQASVIIEFQNINGYGNYLYIDNVNINPTVVANAGNDQSICAGNSVGIGMTAVGGVTYAWSPSTGLSSASVSNPVASPAITTQYVLTATLNSSGYFNRDTVVVTVYPNVTAGVSISANPPGSICAGASVTFTAMPSNGGVAPTYQWKKNSVDAGTGNTYVTSSLANNDTVKCVMTSYAPCVSGNPATSNSIITTVTPNVTASVSISANPGNTICNGASVTFTATPVNGGITPSYQWKKNSVNVGTGSVYTTTSLNNSDTVICMMTSSITCVTPSQVTSNSIVMTVNQYVTPSLTIVVNTGTTICAGTNVTFNLSTSINGGTTPFYQWKKNGVNVRVGGVYPVSSLANNDTVICYMTSNATCVTGNPAASNSFIMTVNPNVTAGVSISANPGNTVCAGTTVTYTAAPVNGGTSPTYQWKKNSVNVGTGITYTTSTLSTNDTIKCVMTSNAPCLSGSPATSNSIIMTVNPNVAAGLSISASPSGAICSGTSVTFTPAPVNGGSTPSYQWKKNSVTVGTGTSYVTSSLVNNDTVIALMTSSNACAIGNPAVSNQLVITVTPGPTAAVSIAVVPGDTVCAGASVTFTASPVNGGTTPSYQWQKNGVNAATGVSYTTSSCVNNDTVNCVMISNAACVSGSPAISNSIVMKVSACNVTINFKAFIEGYYFPGTDTMNAVIDPFNFPTLFDTVTLQLADSASLQIVASDSEILNTHGLGTFNFTGLQAGHRYYLVIRHRNSLETWSAYSFLFIDSTINYDFTRH